MKKIKVFVADSSQIYALGLAKSLSEDERIEIFNHIYTMRHVIDNMGQIKPDIVLIDTTLLNHDDDDTILEILQRLYAKVKIIALIPPEDTRSSINKAVNAGAKSIVPKNISPTELIECVIETANGGTSIYPTLLPQILEKLAAKLEERPVIENPLSTREIEVIELVAEGKSNHDIAQILFLSENTVKGHLKRICRKLNIDNRVEMTRYVLLNRQV